MAQVQTLREGSLLHRAGDVRAPGRLSYASLAAKQDEDMPQVRIGAGEVRRRALGVCERGVRLRVGHD